MDEKEVREIGTRFAEVLKAIGIDYKVTPVSQISLEVNVDELPCITIRCPIRHFGTHEMIRALFTVLEDNPRNVTVEITDGITEEGNE